jgi:hypothetical protein
VAVEL